MTIIIYLLSAKHTHRLSFEVDLSLNIGHKPKIRTFDKIVNGKKNLQTYLKVEMKYLFVKNIN